MLPHPDAVRKITALRDQERLRDVAQQRRAANPGATARSWPDPIEVSAAGRAPPAHSSGDVRAWRDADAPDILTSEWLLEVGGYT